MEKNYKTSFTLNLDVKLKERLAVASQKKFTKMGPLMNAIISDWLDAFEGKVAEVEKEEVRIAELPPEEVLEMRNWELSMVARGDYHQGFAEDPVRCELSPEETEIYLTPDNLPRNGRLFEGETEIPALAPTPLAEAKRKQRLEEAAKEETTEEMEDREFDESLAMSLAEKRE